MSEKKYFAAKLLPPRPTFPFDMTEEEKGIMQRHTKFWQLLLSSGGAIIVGPVLDPNGAYGLGIVVAESEDHVRSMLKDDPACKISEYEIYPMLAMLPPSQTQ